MKEISFRLNSVPPNLLNMRLAPVELYLKKRTIAELTTMLALPAMHQFGVPKAEEGEVRPVTITQYRVNLLDEDGLWASNKPILDGMTRYLMKKMGKQMVRVDRCGLIYNDDPRHLPVGTYRPLQFKVPHYKEQDTVVIVRIL